jgi:hypothetical protein
MPQSALDGLKQRPARASGSAPREQTDRHETDRQTEGGSACQRLPRFCFALLRACPTLAARMSMEQEVIIYKWRRSASGLVRSQPLFVKVMIQPMNGRGTASKIRSGEWTKLIV